jgi:hypothetical protein
MSFFCLCQGRLKLSLKKNLPLFDDNSTKTWKDYTYARFPWEHPSLLRIEQYLDNLPIFQCLSGDPLPLTDHPFVDTRSPSKIAGSIEGEQRTGMNDKSWLRTDEIRFICALLLHNPESNRFFHVLGPMITNRMSIVYDVFRARQCLTKPVVMWLVHSCQRVVGVQHQVASRHHFLSCKIKRT